VNLYGRAHKSAHLSYLLYNLTPTSAFVTLSVFSSCIEATLNYFSTTVSAGSEWIMSAYLVFILEPKRELQNKHPGDILDNSGVRCENIVVRTVLLLGRWFTIRGRCKILDNFIGLSVSYHCWHDIGLFAVTSDINILIFVALVYFLSCGLLQTDLLFVNPNE
jgi:hypothetical protein